MVLFVVLARTTAFLWAVLAGELVLLCFHRGRQLRQVLGAAWQPLCSAPSSSRRPSFWQRPLRPAPALQDLPHRDGVDALAGKSAWHELTGALRTFRIPSLVIFILDTTLRYITILGQEASELLTASSCVLSATIPTNKRP